jgi:hypothetical protein
MPNLFGLNIAEIVNTSISEAGGVLTCTLTKTTPGTRTPGSLSAGTNPTTTAYTVKGFLEQGEKRLSGQLQTVTGTFVSILGWSVSSGTVVPEVNDTITIEGTVYELVELVSRDPAAALYVFRVEA